MDAATLREAMGASLPLAKYQQYVVPFNNAMIAANITTVNRAAMWCAQIGHESVGLKYMKEIGGPAYFARYNNRRDLGNGPSDGPRYPGRGPIQLTGKINYQAFSRWCFAQGWTPDINLFVRQPELVEEPRWGFLAASYYWTVARPKLNAMADVGDIVGCTKAINGGTNGLADRSRRWKRALTFGTRLLPNASEEDDLTPEQAKQLAELHDRVCRMEKAWAGGVTDDRDSPYDMRLLANRQNVEQRQTWLAVQELTKKVDALAARLEV